MTFNLRTTAAGCSLAALLALGAPSIASADTAMAAEVPCSAAAATMMAPMKTADMPAGTTVDKAFTEMMMAHAKAMDQMAKLEMRCGKDKKVKAEAAKTDPVIEGIVNTLRIF